MTHNEERKACTQRCWLMAAGIALVLALLLWFGFGWTFWQSLFTGIVIAIIAGALLGYFLCAKLGGSTAVASRGANQRNVSSTMSGTDTSGKVADQAVKPSATSTTSSASGAASATTVASAAPTAVVSTPSAAVDIPPAAGSADAKASAGEIDPAVPQGEPVAPKVATKNSAAKKPAAKTAAAPKGSTGTKTAASRKPAATKAASTRKARGEGAASATAAPAAAGKAPAEAKPKRAPVAGDGKPEMLTNARAGGADDLKLISGVGPKIEATLNELGVYHFDQVASWRKKEVEWVDERLRFKGRIERDGWIAQAKILAKGGETEFSRKKRT